MSELHLKPFVSQNTQPSKAGERLFDHQSPLSSYPIEFELFVLDAKWTVVLKITLSTHVIRIRTGIADDTPEDAMKTLSQHLSGEFNSLILG
jgi:hypothetical protein